MLPNDRLLLGGKLLEDLPQLLIACESVWSSKCKITHSLVHRTIQSNGEKMRWPGVWQTQRHNELYPVNSLARVEGCWLLGFRRSLGFSSDGAGGGPARRCFGEDG